MGGHFGVLAGMGLGGWLNDHFGWRATMIAIGLPGIAVAAIVRLTVREPERGVWIVFIRGWGNLAHSWPRLFWHIRRTVFDDLQQFSIINRQLSVPDRSDLEWRRSLRFVTMALRTDD